MMATPEAYTQALMDYAGNLISKEVRKRVSPAERLVDVGCGWGKYRFLLPEYEMDGVDIWEPYIEKHKLNQYYRQVYITNAADFDFPSSYGALIAGDMLEHLTIEEAQRFVRSACLHVPYVFIATPFEMEQEEVENNPHEAHVQADLTAEVMAERYPELELFDTFGRPGEHIKAIYVKKGMK